MQVTSVQSPALIWGFFDPSDWQDSVQIKAYADLATLAGKQPSITHPQCSWGKGRASDGSLIYRPFPRARLQADRDLGRYSVLTWMSQNQVNKPDLGFNLRSIVVGAHDAYINKFAQDAAAWAHPFIIRFNHEMNGWWFNGCSEQDATGKAANGNQTGDYVKAWQHIHDIFKANGATNVTWLWCPNVISATASTTQPTSPAKLASFYPGDDYVDLTGTDVYNWSSAKTGGPWISFAQCLTGYPKWYSNTYSALLSIAPSKRMFLGEFGCHDTGGDKGAWINDALTVMPRDFPAIMGWAWFNWSIGGANWPINMPTTAAPAFATAVSPSTYLAANTFQFVPDMSAVKPYAIVDASDNSGVIASLQLQLSQSQTQLQTTAAQLQSVQSDAVSTHAALDQSSATVNQLTLQLNQSTVALQLAQSLVNQYQQATAQLVTGIDGLRSLKSTSVVSS